MGQGSNPMKGEECLGMTDSQYKGLLLDQLKEWQRVLNLAITGGNEEIQKLAQEQIDTINEKLKF